MHAIWELECCDCKAILALEGTGVEGRQVTGVIYCGTFLAKPRRQTVINQLSCWFNPCSSETFFFQFMDF